MSNAIEKKFYNLPTDLSLKAHSESKSLITSCYCFQFVYFHDIDTSF